MTKDQREKILAICQIKENFAKSVKAVYCAVIEKELIDEMWPEIYVKIDFDGYCDEVITLYDELFTSQDIEDLLAFFELPIGQKLLQINWALKEGLGEIGAKYIKKLGDANKIVVP